MVAVIFPRSINKNRQDLLINRQHDPLLPQRLINPRLRNRRHHHIPLGTWMHPQNLQQSRRLLAAESNRSSESIVSLTGQLQGVNW